jgi:hypothetical protein
MLLSESRNVYRLDDLPCRSWGAQKLMDSTQRKFYPIRPVTRFVSQLIYCFFQDQGVKQHLELTGLKGATHSLDLIPDIRDEGEGLPYDFLGQLIHASGHLRAVNHITDKKSASPCENDHIIIYEQGLVKYSCSS